MDIPYFYEKDLMDTAGFILSPETSRHCIQVLRMKEGQELQLTDGRGNLYAAAVSKADKRACEVQVQTKTYQSPPARQITIAISLLKNTSRFEWFLEKSVEIGVSCIIPMLCQRTEKQHVRQDRLEHILISAMLQSRQTWLPFLPPPAAFRDIISHASQRVKLIAHCAEQLKQPVPALSAPADALLLIGPEGDFTKEEIASALEQSFQPVSLGETRLRTETAGMVGAALLMNK